MRIPLAAGLLLLGGLPAGCNPLPTPPPIPDAPKIGPHQATAYALPDGLGYAEIVNEPAVEDRGSTDPTSIVVYFLDKDARGCSATPPTEVKFALNRGRGATETLALRPEPKAGDPAEGCRFASPRGRYRIEEIRGELTANAGGKPIKVSLAETH